MVDRVREIDLPGYRVTVGPGALERAGDIVQRTAAAHRYAIITDENVGPVYSTRLKATLDESRTQVFTIPAGEAHKTRETWMSLTDHLLAAGFARDSTIIALGGGVVGDVAGFVAATFMRGVPFVQIPTSLLAMIDASVGGKTGVDTIGGKNLVGAFHQPAAVIADTMALATLPRDHLHAGFAEAIKHGVIADAEYFDSVVALAADLADVNVGGPEMLDVVARSIEIKADVVRRDERESGVRKTLNFGHTIGHAIELCSGYTLLHGQAVAIGMVCEAELAERLGIAEAGTGERIRAANRTAGLETERPRAISADQIVVATRGDKKARAGQAQYALPARIGQMTRGDGGWSIPVPEAAVREIFG
jgi:3-dehydroquinate synthase